MEIANSLHKTTRMKNIPVGTKVEGTPLYFANFFHKPSLRSYGFIARKSRNPLMLSVRLQGRKSITTWHHSYWKIAEPL